MRENLKAARRAAGLTQQAMADKLGISLRYYQQIARKKEGTQMITTMTKSERAHLYYWNLTPETPLCINCQHFYRHYVLDSLNPGYAAPIDSGHCVYPRTKARYAFDTCTQFKKTKAPHQVPQTPDRARGGILCVKT